ncbi:hypothetical protein FRC03_007672 [Tulasnella sp. 419]|nr:hypothetical protein FRC03_007672 [Tulasnella sp. 419]
MMSDSDTIYSANSQVSEEYLLLLLSDANLPTGSFVASSGLESYIKHGFTSIATSTSSPFVIPSGNSSTTESSSTPQIPHLVRLTINFVRDSLHSYSHSSLPFIRCVHETLDQGKGGATGERKEAVLKEITDLDNLYEIMTLNHVSRRASKAQGVALLTLFSKGFARPAWIPSSIPASDSPQHSGSEALVEELKLLIRKGLSPGHLPVCWGVLTSSLGLGIEKSQRLHLFLHARALLSASIRLNTIGPYAAQQLLLHVVGQLVDDSMGRCAHLRVPIEKISHGANTKFHEEMMEEHADGPANTWPLGEILAGRHDLQHSRIFNS